MRADDPRFFEKLDLIWEDEPLLEPISIDEAIFDEIYRLQEESDVPSKDRTRWL